jgi:putative flippase GtrA
MSSGSLYERLARASFVGRFLKIPLIERVLRPGQGHRGIHKFIRYSMVSVVAVVIAEVVILVCTWGFGLSGIVANTIACVAGTPVSYQLNRKWAWGKSGKSHLWREVAPFWVLTLAGFLASTGTTAWADNMTHSHDVTGLMRSLAIIGASLFAWGVVWVVKFVVFNRLVFVTRQVDQEPEPAQGGTAQRSQPAAPTFESPAAVRP